MARSLYETLRSRTTLQSQHQRAAHCAIHTVCLANHVSGLGDLPDLPFAHSISWQALNFFVGAPQPLLGHLLQYFRLYSSDSPSLSKNWYWPHVWFSCHAALQVKQLANWHFWHIIFGCESEGHESAAVQS